MDAYSKRLNPSCIPTAARIPDFPYLSTLVSIAFSSILIVSIKLLTITHMLGHPLLSTCTSLQHPLPIFTMNIILDTQSDSLDLLPRPYIDPASSSIPLSIDPDSYPLPGQLCLP